jgi:CheY-like chemotaxis protein
MQPMSPLILIADPDAATLAIYDEILRHAGYRTIECQTARAAQQYLHSAVADVLVLDLHLDWDEAGWDLLCLVRQNAATAALPVIVCTTDHVLLRQRARQLAAWQCQTLAKPVALSQLLLAVQAALGVELPRQRAVGE